MKFTVILGDSQVILVTGFGKIRHIKVSYFVFDGRGVSGMCVYDSFYPFSWLNRDCSLQWAVPFIGRRRYNRLINRLKITESIEREIAWKSERKNTVHIHKWHHLMEYLTP